MPIVEAVGTATTSKTDLAKRIEAAMVDAIKAAHKEGVTDNDEIKARMMRARSNVLASEE